VQASLGGKKSESGRTQKRYTVVFFGSFCALIGSALPNTAISYPLIFLGLLLTISNSVSSLFFYAHYESLSLKSYVQSVLIPSLVAINILIKVKTGVKTEYAQLWDIVLLTLGLSTFMVSSLLALSKRRLKSVLIYLSQAWLGALLFLLVIDSEALTGEAFAAYSITAVSSVMLLSVASKLGTRYFSFAKVAALGLPGTVGFAALYFALRLTISLNIAWILALGIGYVVQSITIIGARPGVIEATKKEKVRFWLISATQLAAGVILLWIDKGGLK
jgi:hypothetical protein